MVYVDPKNLGYRPFWERWVNQMPSDDDKAEFIKLFDKYVPPCIAYILEGIIDGRQSERLKTIVPLSNLNMVSISQRFYIILNSHHALNLSGFSALYDVGLPVAVL